MLTRPYFNVLLCSLLAAALPGCKPPPEQITSYEVARGATPAPEKRLTYQVPAAWDELSGDALVRSRGGVRVKLEAGFRCQEGDQVAATEITVFPGGPERLLLDVNRWRGQIKLGELDAQQMRKELQELTVAGLSAHYMDFTGPESSGADRLRTLGVIVPRGKELWFIKMTGHADLVGKHKAVFEDFVKSIRFPEGTGATHG